MPVGSNLQARFASLALRAFSAWALSHERRAAALSMRPRRRAGARRPPARRFKAHVPLAAGGKERLVITRKLSQNFIIASTSLNFDFLRQQTRHASVQTADG